MMDLVIENEEEKLKISDLENYINRICTITKSKQENEVFWFRGDKESINSLLPKVFHDIDKYDDCYENRLLQNFRLKARAFHETPENERIDEWLFFAQHFGIPTRLLDWTESALVALFFAINKCSDKDPVVWILKPIDLNKSSYKNPLQKNIGDHQYSDEFPLTWIENRGTKRYFMGIQIREKKTYDVGHINFKAAWTHNRYGIDLPLAIISSNIVERIYSQKSCFTIHGRIREPLNKILLDKNLNKKEELLKKITIDNNCRENILKDLKLMGITSSSLFPDIEHLCIDIVNECKRLSIRNLSILD
jgi:hypothetical protein